MMLPVYYTTQELQYQQHATPIQPQQNVVAHHLPQQADVLKGFAGDEIMRIQTAGVLNPREDGEHIFAAQIATQIPDLEPGHPRLSMHIAGFTYFGYWIAAPRKRSFYGSYPKSYRPARIEPVKVNGRP